MAAVQSSAIPPSTAEYGGDEVAAIVLDPGYSCTRAGFAGEDVPKSVIPSYYGSIPSDSGERKLLFGDNSVHTPFPGMEISNYMSKDGTVEDWDTATKLWEYAITSRLTSGKQGDPARNGLNDPMENKDLDVEMEGVEESEKALEDNPLLMTETGWNSGKAREKAIEIAIESFGCPAFWLGRNGVLSAFAAGKASALVIDVGASNVSVTPVHDGLVLKKGVIRSPLAGNYVSDQLRVLFSTSTPPIQLTPHYLISSKSPVEAGAVAQATYKTFANPPSDSFRRFQEERVLAEFKESVVQVWAGPGRLKGSSTATSDPTQQPPAATTSAPSTSAGGAAQQQPSTSTTGTINEDIARSMPGRPFEFPDGTNAMFTNTRFQPAESLFDHTAYIAPSSSSAPSASSSFPAPSPSQTLPAMIQNSLNAVDVDIRPHLLSNVVVTGGTSLLYGFTDRLNSELMALYPGPRVRLAAPGNTAERRFGSWIGGSVLGSLGAFHQMWISKKEYEEHGAGIVEKRCK
ncbi:MAG: hypothetical protein M1819_002718 [Sarea resinae]|nr:MAG: hypothetical protein M1819_002718 [Sarea resinae]